MRSILAETLLLLALSPLGCGTSSNAPTSAAQVVTADGGEGLPDGFYFVPPDAGRVGTVGVGDAGRTDAGGGRRDGGPFSNIEHVILIVQENHSFDTYFGSYCTALPGSNPTCTTGPTCCESAPSVSPGDGGIAPTVLDDTTNGAGTGPNHTQACELSELNDGGLDRFTSGSNQSACSAAANFAIAAPATVQTYQGFAHEYALADRYFQPIAGESSSNDMYFAAAHYVFTDNSYLPDTNGHGCDDIPVTPTIEYSGKTTIADALIDGGLTFHTYFEGYNAMLAATLCPAAPSDCPLHVPYEPCVYEPSDNPFQYYSQFADNLAYQKDWSELATDLASGALPNFSFVKHVQYKNEHPGYGTSISLGMKSVEQDIATILGSPYAATTLVLLTWDEGGGFFDHVAPPPTSAVDNQPYGTRVPLLAIGPFAKTNYISHVTMEHSSVVRFLEENFLGSSGQLGARDAVVNSLWDLLDPTATGASFP